MAATVKVNKPKIKLLYITTLPLIQWWYLKGQNQFLVERGFELHSITSREQYFEELAQRDKMHMHSIDISRAIVPCKDMITLIKLFFIIKKIKPDIIHLSVPKSAFLGSIASWLARVPIRVFLVRGLQTENAQGMMRNIFRLAEQITSKLSNICIFTSTSLLEFARQEGIVNENEGEVLANGMSNGIDTQRFRPSNVTEQYALDQLRAGLSIPKEAKVIGYIGRLANDKGITDLAKAWENVRKKFVDAHLLLVGPWFEELDPIPTAVKSALELDPRVHFAGLVSDTVPYYALMTLKVFASHGTEGFPNAPMEAAAMELPVVATKVVGSVDAVVDGLTGTLVEPRNFMALAIAITKYLSDPELCKQHGKAGRERVEKYFKQEIVWEALYNKYCQLLSPTCQYKSKTPMNSLSLSIRKYRKKAMPFFKKILDLVPRGARPYCMGLLSWAPGAVIAGELPRPEGFDKARYAYSVWLRHLVLAFPNLTSFPKTIIELGPGDSLGVGLAALISGANTIYALDSERFVHDNQDTVKTFDNLVRIFSEQVAIPDDDEFHNIKPVLESNLFPSSILTKEFLAASLEPGRLQNIRNSLLDEKVSSADKAIYYFTQEDVAPPIAANSVDMVISQAVMEHVDDIETMYATLYSWLKRGGLMSHQIDFKSHGVTEKWNGHWAYTDFQWRIIEGKRSGFVNREPYSKHLSALQEIGFNVTKTVTSQDSECCESSMQHYKYGELSHEDSITMGALIQAIKPLK